MAMKVGKLWVNYDDTTDVFYLSVGEPRPAVTHEDQDDDSPLNQKRPSPGEPVGLTILEYYGHFRRLPNLSWLGTKGLPPDVVTYLKGRSRGLTTGCYTLTEDSPGRLVRFAASNHQRPEPKVTPDANVLYGVRLPDA